MDAKTETLIPAAQLAKESPVRIKNESAEYRAAGGATRGTARCDTLLGEERAKCLKEQAATGTVKSSSTLIGHCASISPSLSLM